MLGAALIAIPMSRVMAAHGRRPGLVFGYLLAATGAIGLITAGVIRNFPLLLVASVLFGGATASNSQARYAGADLAHPQHRARDLSIVVWATTIGSVVGPNLVGPSAPVAPARSCSRCSDSCSPSRSCSGVCGPTRSSRPGSDGWPTATTPARPTAR